MWGDGCGVLGDTFFIFLMSKVKQFEKTWHYDEPGRRTHTTLRLRKPVMDTVDVASFRDTLIALSGTRPPKHNCARLTLPGPTLSILTTAPRYQVRVSPQIWGEMWMFGCPRSLDWDSESGDGLVDMWNVRYVLEFPLGVSVRVFLVPDDVLCVRTTAAQWNTAGLYGPFSHEERCEELLHAPFRKATVDSCSDSTRMHRGHASNLMCEDASLCSLEEWT